VINSLHKLLHRPERGWDPVPAKHAADYTRLAESTVDHNLVGMLAEKLGGLAGKRVLDLGGGPGQYAVTFACEGACVVWHDISRNYLRIAEARARSGAVNLTFSLGYLEDAGRLSADPFDLVFCRLCWYYCAADRPFAGIIYSLLKPGGAAYIDASTPALESPVGIRGFQCFLNNALWFKVGHPHPPHGRIARLFHQYPVAYMELDYSLPLRDRVFLIKSSD